MRSCQGVAGPGILPLMRVTLIAAQSLDGYITRHDQPGSAFSSPADHTFFRASLRAFDCCAMGRSTYEASREGLRLGTRSWRRVVLTHTPEKHAAAAVAGELEFTAATPKELVTSLRAEGRKACALLGGGQINGRFFAAGLVDEVWLTLEPRLFGGGTALLTGPTDIRLRLLTHEPLEGGALVVKYAVER
jgi:dihydrofolate reductase